MPKESPIELALKEAHAAVRHAQDVRGYHARRSAKGSKQREEDLMGARERLRIAMEPLRSFLGRGAALTQTNSNIDLLDRVSQASQAIQGERRRIWKMQHPNWREASKRPPKNKKKKKSDA